MSLASFFRSFALGSGIGRLSPMKSSSKPAQSEKSISSSNFFSKAKSSLGFGRGAPPGPVLTFTPRPEMLMLMLMSGGAWGGAGGGGAARALGAPSSGSRDGRDKKAKG